MPTISTEILVIGAGATGLGAAWDSALRGYKTLLVEKGDLAHGTSGRYHGLLHSGARYVVRDPRSAIDCYRENMLLKRLMPSAIEDSGGLFVALTEDPPEYVEPFLAGCRAAGIPAEEISPAAALAQEPLLNPALARVFRVPDAACDSFDAAHAVSDAITRVGGEVKLRHRVVRLLQDGPRVVGAEVEDAATGEHVRLMADVVINCTGAWAGQIAALGGCQVNVTPGKGSMVAMNYRLVNTVLNRLKPPSDGDILVPVGTVAVIGTTEVVVDSADRYAVEPWEVELLMAEGEKLLPRFRQFRALRAWAGVRPLYQERVKADGETAAADSRLLTRSHAVLDHTARDGVEGFISVVGGKFTTFRLMAEEALNLAGDKLGTRRPCRTADTPIDPPGRSFHTLGARLAQSETGKRPDIICECELVNRGEIEQALRQSKSLVLNDLRRDLRLGMGPCQAGFCAYRAAGILHAVYGTTDGKGAAPPEAGSAADTADVPNVLRTNSALMEFLQERWKGLRPVMWGANLRQMELDVAIYRSLLGADRLPLARQPEEYPTEKTA
jgi:glycerol-3-phosphate dehydrogenase